MALTVMLSLASSAASFRVRWCTAAFCCGGGGGEEKRGDIILLCSCQYRQARGKFCSRGMRGLDVVYFRFKIGSRECVLVNLK